MNAIKILINMIMKKIKIVLISVFTVMATLTSCEENVVIYDPATGQTLAFFSNSSSNLPVLIDQSATVDLELGVSTLSSSDRSVDISIDPSSTADPLNYTIPSSVTIPANEYFGYLTVSAVDNTIETTAETIKINIGTVDGAEVAGNASHTISLFQVCEITPGTFVGDYLIEQLTPINPCDGVQLFEDQVVAVASTGETSRSFAAIYLEGISSTFPDLKINFSLVCNDVIVGVSVSNLSCGTPPAIDVGPATTPANYDSQDDSVFELTLTEYYTSDGGCGCDPYETTFRFTKQ